MAEEQRESKASELENEPFVVIKQGTLFVRSGTIRSISFVSNDPLDRTPGIPVDRLKRDVGYAAEMAGYSHGDVVEYKIIIERKNQLIDLFSE